MNRVAIPAWFDLANVGIGGRRTCGAVGTKKATRGHKAAGKALYRLLSSTTWEHQFENFITDAAFQKGTNLTNTVTNLQLAFQMKGNLKYTEGSLCFRLLILFHVPTGCITFSLQPNRVLRVVRVHEETAFLGTFRLIDFA